MRERVRRLLPLPLPLPLPILAATALLAACTSRPPSPDLGALYSRTAREAAFDRNPVIVIPGILGTRLVDEETQRVVWGAFAGDYADPRTADGARLIALPMGAGAALADLRDGVRTDGVLDRVEVRVFGLPIRLRAYIDILRTLGIGGYRDQLLGQSGAIDYGPGHFTCFQFDYDWRRDNIENARRLHEFILERRRYVKKALSLRYGIADPEVKFDIVAHSMGALVARYYLRFGTAEPPPLDADVAVPWSGAPYVERVVMVGPPDAGSAEALLDMVRGVKFSFPLPRYAPALLGTMPSLYEILPRARHRALADATRPDQPPLDPLDPALWESFGWGLAAPDQDPVLRRILPGIPDAAARRRIALEHLRKCLERARRFQHALDLPAAPPPGLHLYLVAGDAVDTPRRLAVDPRDGSLEILERAPGDGTVTRASALMDERMDGRWEPNLRSPVHWSQVLFLATRHMEITRDPAFVDNVLYLLLEDRRRGSVPPPATLSPDGSGSPPPR